MGHLTVGHCDQYTFARLPLAKAQDPRGAVCMPETGLDAYTLRNQRIRDAFHLGRVLIIGQMLMTASGRTSENNQSVT